MSRSIIRDAQYIIPFFAYPPEIRKVIYTTNAIESMNSSLRKVIKDQQIFPTDEADEQVGLSGDAKYLEEVDDAD